MITTAVLYAVAFLLNSTIGIVPAGILPESIVEFDYASLETDVRDYLSPVSYWIPFGFIGSTIIAVAGLKVALWGVKFGLWVFGAVTGGGTR